MGTAEWQEMLQTPRGEQARQCRAQPPAAVAPPASMQVHNKLEGMWLVENIFDIMWQHFVIFMYVA